MDDSINTEEVKEELKKVWIKMLEDLKSDKDLSKLPDALKWVETVMTCNVPFGKQNRATTIVAVYRHVKKERTPEMDFRACVIGWVLEMFQATAMIADDIIDGSTTRRGQPCWYTRCDVGMSAINDAMLLENLIFRLIRKYFNGTAFYEKLLHNFQDMLFQTIVGESLDTRFSNQPDNSKFTRSTYDDICKYKTGFYSFYGPVALGLILAEINDTAVFDSVKEILLDIGRFAQIQDDYLDLYGDPKVTGKIGTDIINGKCTWLIIEALERATIEQKSILQESYGSKKIEDVNKVEEIYKALNMQSVYKEFETKTYDQISKVIDTFEPESLRKPVKGILSAYYKREK